MGEGQRISPRSDGGGTVTAQGTKEAPALLSESFQPGAQAERSVSCIKTSVPQLFQGQEFSWASEAHPQCERAP